LIPEGIATALSGFAMTVEECSLSGHHAITFLTRIAANGGRLLAMVWLACWGRLVSSSRVSGVEAPIGKRLLGMLV